VYPRKKRGWRAQRAGHSKTCAHGKSVRADRHLRPDDDPVRAQAAIFDKPVLLIFN